MAPNRLVLWDVDHTLIEARGVGGEAFCAAFEAATGHPLAAMPDPTGLTDAEIFRRAAAPLGIDADAVFDRFAAHLAAEYRVRGDALRSRGRDLPGARAVLSAAAGSRDLLQTVLSGNTRAGSAAKLAAFELDAYLDLEAAAGGDDDPVRANLVPVVWKRVAEKYGLRFGPADTVLIGDTPADVATGHAHGCRVVAVATGRIGAGRLRAVGADTVLPDLTATRSVLAAIRR